MPYLILSSKERAAFRLFRDDPAHPSLRFKRVHTTLPLHSARISRDWRVLGFRNGDEVVWFWIGTHDEYERMLRRA